MTDEELKGKRLVTECVQAPAFAYELSRNESMVMRRVPDNERLYEVTLSCGHSEQQFHPAKIGKEVRCCIACMIMLLKRREERGEFLAPRKSK